MRRLTRMMVGVGCGGIAGCLYLAVTFGTPGALILVYLTQLPLFVAGLWLGSGAAALAGLTGSLVLLATNDLLAAVIFAALNALPAVLLVRQALLARRRADGSLMWYPPGLLTAWLTGMALAGLLLAVVLAGGPGSLQAELRGLVGEMLDHLSRRPVPDRGAVVAAITAILPGVVAASWMITSVGNAALAQGLLARFGANWRPSPDLAGLGLPIWLPIALGVGAAGTFFAGAPRFLGVNAMIALLVPFCLAGLAVLHLAVRRLAQPAMALTVFYTVAALFGWPFLAIAVLGLLESWLGLRRRLAPQGVRIDG